MDSSDPSVPIESEWPANHESYELLGKIGYGAFATVWRGKNLLNGQPCAIKIIDLESIDTNFVDIRLEVQTMRLSSHPNILNCYTSFVMGTSLWLVTQFMSKGSSLRCIQSLEKLNAPNIVNSLRDFFSDDEDGNTGGIMEHNITYILFQTILGLKYIHDNGQIHRDIKAGNILLDGSGDVRIADFGVSGWLNDINGNRRENTKTFVGTPCWMAPEVMEQVYGYDYKADIWSLGITALELAKGIAPYAKYPPMKVLLMTIQEPPPSLETYNDNDDLSKWSRSFREIIRLCLQKDPKKRPSCEELLNHRHFKRLSDISVLKERKDQIKVELCDMIEDVGIHEGSVQHKGLGSQPVYIDTRPAGTTWNFSDGSQVFASPSKSGENYDDKDAFFDEFERQTQGENFSSAVALEAEDEKIRQAEIEAEAERKARLAAEKEEERQKQSERDELDQFFDEFEQSTQGENFKRAGP